MRRRFSEPAIKMKIKVKRDNVARADFVDYKASKERLEEFLDYAVVEHKKIRFFSRSASQKIFLFDHEKYVQAALSADKDPTTATTQEKHCIEKIRKLS